MLEKIKSGLGKDWRCTTAAGFLAALLVSWFIMVVFALPCDDDLVFRYDFHSYLTDGGPFPSLHRLWQQVKYNYFFTNSRSGDQIISLLELCPQWVFAAIYTATVGGIIAMFMRVGSLTLRRNPWRVVAITFIFTFFFPYWDAPLSRAIFWNYFPVVLFALYSLSFFTRPDAAPKPGWKMSVWLVAAGFLTASWHEQLAISLFIALLVYLMIARNVNRRRLLIISGGVLGGIYHLICPAIYYRMDNDPMLGVFPEWAWDTKRALILCFLIFLIGIVALIYRKRHKQPMPKSMPAVWAMWTALPVACVLVSLIFGKGRLFYIPDAFCMAATLCCLPERWKINRYVKGTAVALMIAMTLTHIVAVAVVNARQRQDFKRLIVALQTAENPREVYFDTDYLRYGHWLALERYFGRAIMYSGYFNYVMPRYYGIDHLISFNIIPEDLRDFDPEKLVKVPSDQGEYYMLGERLIIPDVWQTDRSFGGMLTASMHDPGRDICVPYGSVRVRDKNGRYWFWLNLHHRFGDNYRKLKRVVYRNEFPVDIVDYLRLEWDKRIHRIESM